MRGDKRRFAGALEATRVVRHEKSVDGHASLHILRAYSHILTESRRLEGLGQEGKGRKLLLIIKQAYEVDGSYKLTN